MQIENLLVAQIICVEPESGYCMAKDFKNRLVRLDLAQANVKSLATVGQLIIGESWLDPSGIMQVSVISPLDNGTTSLAFIKLALRVSAGDYELSKLLRFLSNRQAEVVYKTIGFMLILTQRQLHGPWVRRMFAIYLATPDKKVSNFMEFMDYIISDYFCLQAKR